MRKITLLFTIMAMLFAALPGFAQEESNPTIADIVVSSAQAETPQFTTLLTAVQAADPAVLELLSNPDSNVTVFAPTDEAFAALIAALGEETFNGIVADPAALTDILLYHVVPVALNSDAVLGLDGGFIGTALPETALPVAVQEDGSVRIGEAGLVLEMIDIEASNGIIHVIDSVLVPPMPADDMEMADEGEMEMMETVSIADTVIAAASAEEAQFTILLAAVQAADPAILQMLLDGGPYTVFAPTDEAFAALLESLGMSAEEVLANTDLLNQVLAYHVVPGYFSAETVLGLDGAMVATAAGTPLSISIDGETVRVNESNVVMTDIAATNGIIHVIDSVLLPPSEE